MNLHFLLDEEHEQFIGIIEIAAVNPVSPLKKTWVLLVNSDIDLFAVYKLLDTEISDVFPKIPVFPVLDFEGYGIIADDNLVRISKGDERFPDDVQTDNNDRNEIQLL